MSKLSKFCLRSTGFTLVEMLVVIAIIAVLVATLVPTVGKAKARGQEADCSSNLRQIGLGISAYTFDYRSYPPKPTGNYGGDQRNVLEALDPYISTNSMVWFCKRHISLDRTTPEALRANNQISYFNWMYLGNNSISEAATSNAWSALVTTNITAGMVLLSDRFEANNTKPFVQIHGNRPDSPLSQPGTLVLITGGSVLKVAPTKAP